MEGSGRTRIGEKTKGVGVSQVMMLFYSSFHDRSACVAFLSVGSEECLVIEDFILCPFTCRAG